MMMMTLMTHNKSTFHCTEKRTEETSLSRMMMKMNGQGGKLPPWPWISHIPFGIGYEDAGARHGFAAARIGFNQNCVFARGILDEAQCYVWKRASRVGHRKFRPWPEMHPLNLTTSQEWWGKPWTQDYSCLMTPSWATSFKQITSQGWWGQSCNLPTSQGWWG